MSIPVPVEQENPEGLTLVLDAAEGPLQLAIADAKGNPLFASTINAPSRGVEVLTFMLESALTLLEKKATDITRIAATRGPGGFTGIRLTASTAAGLARAVSARQAGLDYMKCIARQCEPFLKTSPARTLLWVLTRARRDLVYAQAFIHDQENSPPVRAVTELAVLAVSSGETAMHLMEAAKRYNASHFLLAGSGAHENRGILELGLAEKYNFQATFLDILAPQPTMLLRAASEAEYTDADIEPLYIRASDAEANLPQIAARLGLNPDNAVKQLHALTHTTPLQG